MNLIIMLMLFYASFSFCADNMDISKDGLAEVVVTQARDDVQKNMPGFVEVFSAQCGDPNDVYEIIISEPYRKMCLPRDHMHNYGQKGHKVSRVTSEHEYVHVAGISVAILSAPKEDQKKLQEVAASVRKWFDRRYIHDDFYFSLQYDSYQEGPEPCLTLKNYLASLICRAKHGLNASSIKQNCQNITLLGDEKVMSREVFKKEGTSHSFERLTVNSNWKSIFLNNKCMPEGQRLVVFPLDYDEPTAENNAYAVGPDCQIKTFVESKVCNYLRTKIEEDKARFKKEYPLFKVPDLISTAGQAPVVTIDIKKLTESVSSSVEVEREMGFLFSHYCVIS
jgi:hypothetical protein